MLVTTSSAMASRSARLAWARNEAAARSRRHVVARHQALDLQRLGNVNDQHAVGSVTAAALGEQRNHEH